MSKKEPKKISNLESLLGLAVLAAGTNYILNKRESGWLKTTKGMLPLAVFSLGVIGFVSEMMLAPMSILVKENEKDIAFLAATVTKTTTATIGLSTDYVKVNSKINQIAEDVAEMRKFDSKEAINDLRSIILNFGTQLQSFKRDSKK